MKDKQLRQALHDLGLTGGTMDENLATRSLFRHTMSGARDTIEALSREVSELRRLLAELMVLLEVESYTTPAISGIRKIKRKQAMKAEGVDDD